MNEDEGKEKEKSSSKKGRCRPGSNSWRTAKFNAVAVCNEIAVLCYFGRRLIKATFKEQLSLVRPKIGWAALKGHRAICNKCVHVETICSFDRGGGTTPHVAKQISASPPIPRLFMLHTFYCPVYRCPPSPPIGSRKMEVFHFRFSNLIVPVSLRVYIHCLMARTDTEKGRRKF